MSEEKVTYIWLDWVRAIGIYWVVLGHLMLPVLGVNWIYTFHMPLFFFISGFLFDFEKYKKMRSFIKIKAMQLLLPYLLFNLLTYLIWLVKMEIEPDVNVNIQNVFYQIFYGGTLPHNTPLWFLMALFITETIVYFLYTRIKGRNILILFLVLSWVTQYIGWVPLYIDAAIVGVPFYIMAYLCKCKIMNLLNLHWKRLIIFGFVLFLITCFLSGWNGRIDMLSNHFGATFFLFELGAIVGIFFMFVIGRICQSLFNSCRAVKYISRNTIVILALHITVLRVIKGLFMIMNVDDSIWHNCFFNIVLAAVVIFLLLPVIYVIKRFVPVFIGK